MVKIEITELDNSLIRVSVGVQHIDMTEDDYAELVRKLGGNPPSKEGS